MVGLGNFLENSLIVDYSIDIKTGEVFPILQRNKDIIQKKLNCKTGITNDNGRIIGEWGVEKVRILLNGLNTTKGNSSVDIESENFGIEVKTCRVGNAIIIRGNQLEDISNIEGEKKYYYVLVYYKRKNSEKNISELTQDEIKQELKVDKIYIFPLEYIIYFYNDDKYIRIKAKEGLFKKIHRKIAQELFDLDTGSIFKKNIMELWGADIKIIEYKKNSLSISKRAMKK